MGFARGEESVDDESESLHSSAMKESAALATTESLSPPTADEDESTPNLQSNSSIPDSIMEDSLKPVPTSQPSQSVPLADVPTEKLSTSSSSFMFDGMSVSAAKMQNPEQKESSLTKSISKETPEAVNKSDAASSGREQREEDGATGSTSNRRDGYTTDPLAQQTRSTTAPLTPAAAVVVSVTAPAIATVAASTSTSSAYRISGIDFNEEAASIIDKSGLPSFQEKEHGGGGEKESKKLPRSSASSMEVASSKQRRAALQPAYEQRGMVSGRSVKFSNQNPFPIASYYITSHNIVLHHTTQHHIASHRIASHRITSHHITTITYQPIPSRTLHHCTLHFLLVNLHVPSLICTTLSRQKLCSEFETEMSRLMMLQTDAARERSEQRRELLRCLSLHMPHLRVVYAYVEVCLRLQ